MHQINPRPTTQLSAQQIREGLVARIRQEIQDGTYETPEKLEEAVERLIRTTLGCSTAQG